MSLQIEMDQRGLFSLPLFSLMETRILSSFLHEKENMITRYINCITILAQLLKLDCHIKLHIFLPKHVQTNFYL